MPFLVAQFAKILNVSIGDGLGCLDEILFAFNVDLRRFEVNVMQAEFLYEFFCKFRSSHAISYFVERGRVNGNPAQVRDHNQDRSTDSGLGRHAYLEHPLPRVVLHAAAQHDGETVAHFIFFEYSFFRERVDAPFGEGGCHD